MGSALSLTAVAALSLSAPATSQTLTVAQNNGKAAVPSLPSLASMEQAFLSQDYTVEQLRRFRDENGSVVTVRERLEVDANGTARPDFAITFLGVEGEPPGSSLTLEWQQAYSRHGTLFFRHGSFHVRDMIKAASNYTLHDFGQVVRAGRVARRMVVFPKAVFPHTADKPIWVIEVDGLTSVPLFIAEFDSQFQMFANIEAVSFSASVQMTAPTMPIGAVTPMANFVAAEVFLGSPTGLINPNMSLVQDYDLDTVEVHHDPINGSQRLIMSYTDGIDQFMVVQAINSLDPFAGLPSATVGAHTIGRFRDPAVSALVFWEDGVSFHIAGRGAMQRLDSVARSVYLQALSN